MHLFIDEIKRERDFYKSRNMPCPKDIPQNHDDDTFNDSHIDSDYHRQDEQVNVCLECKNNINALSRRFIRCSSQATITHLKKFVAKKVLSGMDKYKEVILYVRNRAFRWADAEISMFFPDRYFKLFLVSKILIFLFPKYLLCQPFSFDISDWLMVFRWLK